MIPVIGFAAGFIFPLAFYILPTDSFFKKGMTLGFVGAGLAVLYLWSAGASGKDVVQWALIIVGLTTFIAMDFSGMSSVSNYSRIKKEYSVVLPFLGLIVLSYIMISFLWR